MVAIELNGEPREMKDGDSVQDLIDALSLTGQALAVAVNREVVPRARWPSNIRSMKPKASAAAFLSFERNRLQHSGLLSKCG